MLAESDQRLNNQRVRHNEVESMALSIVDLLSESSVASA